MQRVAGVCGFLYNRDMKYIPYSSSHTEPDIPVSNLKYFLSYFKPHLNLFIADMLCATFISAVDLAFPMISRWIINDVLPEFRITPGPAIKIFVIVIAVLFGLYLLRYAAQWFVTYFGHMFGVHVETDMRRDIFAHLENQSFTFFDANRTGKIMSRATYDLFEVSELAHHGPEDLFLSVITLVGAMFLMLQIRWELAVVIFVTLPVLIMRLIFSKKAMMATSRTVKDKTAEINAGLESSISGIRVTKVFTNEDYENKRFDENNHEYFGAKSGYYRAMATFHTRIDFTTHILSVIVLATGGFLIMKGRMNLGDLIAANLFVAAFLQPIRQLANLVEQFSTGIAGFQRFAEIMRSHDETKEKNGAEVLSNVRGDVCYNNVCFSYNNGVSILKNVNLEVSAGKTIALVGPSGSGKTTLCHLLPRFYEITSGSITLDGTDIRDITVNSLRRQIGIVQQDVFLFAGTIRENIAYGKIGATDEEIIEAAKHAEIHEDIQKMPNGYDTMVGERGIKLSGGQKQRVSIARIFLKNPPILILDEATSSLDTATEIRIQHAFDELAKGRTTFIIAHRLSTIKNANRIAVVSNEGIMQSGTHDELMQSGGIYRELYTAQFGQDPVTISETEVLKLRSE
jgi:ATP-binding cassette, subfamily B, bacterial